MTVGDRREEMMLNLIVDSTEHLMENVSPRVASKVSTITGLHFSPVFDTFLSLEEDLPGVVVREDGASVTEVDSHEDT